MKTNLTTMSHVGQALQLALKANKIGPSLEEQTIHLGDLTVANEQIDFSNKAKQKSTAEHAVGDKKSHFQKKEKKKRSAELITANIEIARQNEEKEKRAAELAIANKKLVKENKAKKKRAAQLIIANKELLFQNSEKAKRARELEVANKELESFSYSVSHDLRAPLRAINGFTQVLLEDYQEQFDEEVKNLLDEIVANSKKMGELIDNLLEFSRVGKQHVSKTEINMQALVDSVICDLRQQFPKLKTRFTGKIVGNIKADKHMLKQVFINLISNALKYSGKKEKAEIEVGSYDEKGNRVYYVKDNGVGFDMRYYDKLFGVFQRLHSNVEFEGTGVGLALIHKIITKHEGKVWAEAKVNEGACFYISLPIL
ncbi:MAG: ATP-binding protein [Chitinophagaceae bacterium]